MNVIKHVPNAITCLNLCSGCIACTLAFEGQLLWASLFVLFGAIFDFFDGFAARLLHAYSPIGKELDSLADVVSFGVAPGMILFYMLSSVVPLLSAAAWVTYIPYLAFIIPSFSALRLAKFNVDERQTTSFIGLPTPANALFWISIIYSTQQLAAQHVILYIAVALLLVGLTSYLLIAEIPMFSLKIKSIGWKGNEYRYVLIASTVLFVTLWGFLGVSATILLYIILSIISRTKS